MKRGLVGIVGRPNVGKSTLLNTLLESKIAITSDVSGTTRDIIYGIYNDLDSQIVFIDTPGITKPVDLLGESLNKKIDLVNRDFDVILFLVDSSTFFGKEDQFILDKFIKLEKPIFLVLTKIDLIDKNKLLEQIVLISEKHNFSEVYPISSIKDINISELIYDIKKNLKDGEKYFFDDEVTNIPEDKYIKEIIRQKCLFLLKEEIPHTIAVSLDYLNNEDVVEIDANIITDRKNLVKIIKGKNNSMINKITKYSSHELEKYYNKEVHLDLKIKVIENWRNNPKYMKDLI